jgi:hypothetical protein
MTSGISSQLTMNSTFVAFMEYPFAAPLKPEMDEMLVAYRLARFVVSSVWLG